MRREAYAERIRTSQIELLGSVLTRAFYNNPCAAYILPEPDIREAALSWFFNAVAIRASRLCGEIYTTPSVVGGALWIRPGVDLTIRHAVKTEILSLPFRLHRQSLMRWVKVVEYLEAARRTLADKDHWYLLALGTEPSTASNAIRRTLMAPVLSEADWDQRPCYVETFDQTDLPLYEQHGFRISAAGQIPGGGPGFWTLIRPPRRHESRRSETAATAGYYFGRLPVLSQRVLVKKCAAMSS
jgi:hypothetical protein